jgi:hypothetical protein
MASSYSTDLKLELMVTGENSGTWGDITNTNLVLLQQSIAGYEAVSIAGGAQTTALAMTDGALSNARNAVIKLTGTITGNQVVTIPDGIEKTYTIENGTVGAFTVEFKTVSGTGPTWSTTDKGKKILYSDGTNILEGISSIDTLKVSTFTSTGIDDNAASTAITIDSSENVDIVGTTTSSNFIADGTGYAIKIAFNGTATLNTNSSPVIFSGAGASGDYLAGTLNLQSRGDGTARDINLITGATPSNTLTAHGNGDISFYEDTGTTPNFFWDASAESLGIGETAPLGKVHIKQNDSGVTSAPTFADALFIEDNSNTGITICTPTNGIGTIAFGDSGDNDIGKFQYQHSDNSMLFVANAAERMRITSAGNVGIGTSSPGEKLDINGSARVSTGSSYQFGGSDYKIEGSNVTSPRIGFITDSTERMRIDSSGRVGIGTSSSRNLPSVGIPQLQVEGANTGASTVLVVNTANDTTPSAFALLKARGSSVVQNNDEIGRISFNGWDGSEEREAASISAFIDTFPGASDMPGRLVFKTTPNASATPLERMRITSVGTVLMGKAVSDSGTTAGFEFSSSCTQVTRDADVALVVNRLTNDGVLVVFRQNTTDEGNISVSGSTVSYNGFTGTHWSRFTDNSKPNILRGTVLESLDEMCDWYNLEFDVTTTTQDEDGNDVTNTHTEKVPHVLLDSQSNGDVITYNHEGTDVQATIVKEVDIKHMKAKVSDTTDAKNVYGVFSSYDEDGEGYNDFYVASVGSFVVRIKQGETIAKGDLLQSNGDGTAKVQTDDAVRSSSFAKVLSTTIIETYEDGSYLVPCSLMC